MNINKLRKANLNLQKDRIKKGEAVKIINYLLETKYVYNFDWLGIPSIQFPSDLMVFQEVIYNYKPDVIIETGVAHGGSLIFYSSIMSLIKKKFKVFGIDIKIKKKNRIKISKHPLAQNIELIEKSSTDESLKVFFDKKIKNSKVLIFLDSNHSHEHVLNEIKLYSKYIKKNGYLVVMDTTTEFVKKKFINKGRNFGKGNSPFTAVKEFLKTDKSFIIDKYYEDKSFITSCFSGFLRKR
tara:strand:+ start:1600 stop:2316 length:717 start_codon:yes stop_codon:yes gene_type:complete